MRLIYEGENGVAAVVIPAPQFLATLEVQKKKK